MTARRCPGRCWPKRSIAVCLFPDGQSVNLDAMKTFGQILESADELPVDDQESLVGVLQRRVAEKRRNELIEAVKESRLEFKRGGCRPARPREIVRKILA
jgi:hypothetical protein